MILNVLSTLASIPLTAKGWGYVCQMVDYKCLTLPTEEVQTEARFFTVEEVGKIIAAAREPYKTMFMLLAMTGMRAGEMLGLQWPDIDFEKGFLNIRRSAWYGRVQTTKNKTARRSFHYLAYLRRHSAHFGNSGNQIQTVFCSSRETEGPPHPTRLWSTGFGRCLISWPSPAVVSLPSDTLTRVYFSTRAQLRRLFRNSYGTQIPASLSGSMPTFSEMLTAKRSRKWPRLCSKVFQRQEKKRSTFSSFQAIGVGFDSHRPLHESDALERTCLESARRRSTLRRPHLTSEGQSDRSASVTLMRAARAAGTADATTAAASRTSAEATTGAALGICMSRK